jgi:Zn-dependent protease
LSLAILLPTLAVLILSLSFHEAAHAWAADRLGDPTARLLGRLTMNPLAHIDWIGTVLFPLVAFSTGAPLIGWAKPVPVNMRNLKRPRQDFALVALAGPVSNLILAAAAMVILTATGLPATPIFVGGVASVLTSMVLLNVLLAVFNMIPVPPLDGGNVLAGIAPEPVARVFDQLRPFGIFILYGLLLSGALEVFVYPVYDYVLSWLM